MEINLFIITTSINYNIKVDEYRYLINSSKTYGYDKVI
jgi:hypothetical protein